MNREEDSTNLNRQEGNRVEEKVDAKIQDLGGPSHIVNISPDLYTGIMCRLGFDGVARNITNFDGRMYDEGFVNLYSAPISVMVQNKAYNRAAGTLHFLQFEDFKKFDTFDSQLCLCEYNSLKTECKGHFELKRKYKLPFRELGDNVGKMSDINSYMKSVNFNVVNSCNGFICFSHDVAKDSFIVCNPMRSEFIRLPNISRILKFKKLKSSGFGFQPKTNEYNVIIMYSKSSELDVHMHTLGTSTWKNIGQFDQKEIRNLNFPTCVNGSLHWVSWDGLENSILCFNIESECFLPFPFPPQIPQPRLEEDGMMNEKSISMGELKGLLYICDVSCTGHVRMCVMKEYGNEKSWSMDLSIDNIGVDRWSFGTYWTSQLFKDAMLLYNFPNNHFIYYESGKLTKFNIGGISSQKCEVFPYIPSLVSLKNAIKGDNVEVIRINPRPDHPDDKLYLVPEHVEDTSSEIEPLEC